MTEIFVKNEVDGSLLDAIEKPEDVNAIGEEMESVSELKKSSLFKKIKSLKESGVPISMLQRLPLPPIPSNPSTISGKAAASEAPVSAPVSAASEPTKQVVNSRQIYKACVMPGLF